MKRCLLAAVLLFSAPAFAGGPCGGFFSSSWVAQPDFIPVQIHGGAHVGGGTVPGEAVDGGLGALGAMNDAKAMLIVAVIAAATLPLFLYVIDEGAQQDVMHCWASPTQSFNLYGGGITGGLLNAAFVGGRGAFTLGPIAFEASGESSPFNYYDVGAAFSLRAPPRQHVELGLAFGVRQLADRFDRTSYVELALPHRYLPFRFDAYNPGVGLELRPAVLWSGVALDVRLDAALVIPFGHWATLALGGRTYSYGSNLRFGLQLGFNVNV